MLKMDSNQRSSNNTSVQSVGDLNITNNGAPKDPLCFQFNNNGRTTPTNTNIRSSSPAGAEAYFFIPSKSFILFRIREGANFYK
jgi:hypothetical protein